ncbi:S8 family peptidase [Actinokineospora enzanensis]|uniref:S8 family peptidase n=1 Tax=Actinokineospora enzanensis TaxID=155975 RepID=UPI0003800AE7|nr:S8 family peptidase [Actinokineospora enzanensis]
MKLSRHLAVATLVAAFLVGHDGTAGSAKAPPGAPPGPTDDGTRITLITGDVVDYRQDDGTVRVDPAVRADGSSPTFATMTTRDGLFVYPSDAVPLVRSGELDPALFDVRALLADGRQDATSPTIPVIARTDGKATSLAPRVRLKGGMGTRVEKSRAPQFWHSLTTGGLGVAKLSLDRKLRVAGADTVRSTNITAQKLGLDGTGTRIAVVDTGVDSGHPDLKDKVAAAEDFTGSGDTGDHNGHGTHVASTIAGSGAASGGRYRGIAPGATLLSAKVFDDTGSGEMSQVMAGVEWAAGQGVDVLNLSLGGGVTDGSDPLSRLVDELSASTGMLFVVAAGNYGSGDRTVATPGSAASALTVGAVDGADKLAWFSSRGPRLGDALAKPEIVAPGVGIVAARASGTSMGDPVDEYYTSADGTSMATPQVAGAAALLRQQHPDWRGPALKDALVSTARDVGAKWYEQGAGKLDIDKALSQAWIGPASATFGRVEGTDPTDRALTYTNQGDASAALSLDLRVDSWDGKPSSAETMRLAGGSLGVPAHAAAKTDVTVDPDAGRFGVYGGTVVAKASNGATVRTPVSTYNAPPLMPVSIHLLDSTGAPARQGIVEVIDDTLGATRPNDPFATEDTRYVDLVDGEGRVMVPEGAYSALGWVMERTLTTRRWTGLSAAEVRVAAGTDVTLDARSAVPVDLTTTTRTDLRDRTVALRRILPGPNGPDSFIAEVGASIGPNIDEVRVTPAAAAKVGSISLQDHAARGSAAVDLAVGGTTLNPVYDVPTVTAALAGTRELALVAAGTADVRGKAVVARIAVPPGSADPVGAVNQATTAAAKSAAQAGAAALVTYVDSPGALPVRLNTPPLPVFSLTNADGTRLGTAARMSLTVRAVPEAMYDLDVVDANGVPADHERRIRPDDLVATKTSYHADQPGLTGQKVWYAFPDKKWRTQFNQAVKVPLPGAWTEYVGPGNADVVWKRTLTASGTGAALAMNRYNVYRPGERTRPDEHWFDAPLHSAAVELAPDSPGRYPSAQGRWQTLCSLCREGDLFTPALQWTDGDGFVNPYENSKYGATTTTRLYLGDQEIKPVDEDMAPYPRFRLGAGSAVYRLEESDVMAGAGQPGAPSTVLFGHARRTDTTWTFTSSRANDAPPAGYTCRSGSKCAFQPLIQLDYRLPLDLGNTLTARTFDIAAAVHTGAKNGGPVVGLQVATSTDGKTWTDAPVQPAGGSVWTVTAPAYPGGTDVWLRTQARDSKGNTVSQTIQAAYRGR